MQTQSSITNIVFSNDNFWDELKGFTVLDKWFLHIHSLIRNGHNLYRPAAVSLNAGLRGEAYNNKPVQLCNNTGSVLYKWKLDIALWILLPISK